ncbi:protein-disulfide reductase DsbD domain-containing protein [Jejuia pallidilutea]|uniref:protein-disulfide reductase DsbD domain-containing protein n=1 Tax=Jejuia pallidilutea TaxID=504487 RepID=UPI0005AA3BCC|nr:protein-disulfide reductase DsbD domain-containing protein [Jejuia pallidilutea]
MKKLTLILLFTSTLNYAQVLKPVTWETSVEKVSNSNYNLVFTATISNHWHLYSQNVPEGGPLPTQFTFNISPNFRLEGKVLEGKGMMVFEEVFDMKVKYFEERAVFKQNIKVRSNKHFKISGNIQYMSCNSESCMPGFQDFEFYIKQ